MKLKLLKTIAPIAGVATIAALPLSSCGEPATYTADIKAIAQGEYQRITEYKEPDSIDADEALSLYMQDVKANPAIIFDDACEYYAITNTWLDDVEVSGTVSITVTKAQGARFSFIADANLMFLHPTEYEIKEEVRGRLEAHNIKLAMWREEAAVGDELSPWLITSAYVSPRPGDHRYNPRKLKDDTKWSYTIDGVYTRWISGDKIDYEISSKYSHESDIEELAYGLGALISYFQFTAQYFKDITF